MTMRKICLWGLGLIPCLILTQCVIGGGGGPCKNAADCGGSKVCFGGVCLDPQSETVRNAEVPITPDAASEKSADSGVDAGVDARPDVKDTRDVQSDTNPDGGSGDAQDPDNAVPEPLGDDVPEARQLVPQRRFGLTSGGGQMSSSGYRLYGSVGAGLLGYSKAMSSPNYQLKAGIIAGTTP